MGFIKSLYPNSFYQGSFIYINNEIIELISSYHPYIKLIPIMIPFDLTDYTLWERPMIWSLDVIKMYPSIKHDYLLKMIDFYWDKYNISLHEHPSKECIKSLLYYSLKNTVTSFNDINYLKTKGYICCPRIRYCNFLSWRIPS